MRSYWLVIPVLVLLACGKSKGGSNPNPGPQVEGVDTEVEGVDTATGPFSYYLEDPSKLPACDEARDTALAYVVSEKAFYACSAGSWEVVEIQGVDSFKEQLKETGLYVVMDSQAKLLGYTTAATSSVPTRLTKDGFKVVVDIATSSITADTLCYFNQASCAGDCFIPLAEKKSAMKGPGSICAPTTSSISNVSANGANPFLSRFEGGSCVPMVSGDPRPSADDKYKKGDCQDFSGPFSVKRADETVN